MYNISIYSTGTTDTSPRNLKLLAQAIQRNLELIIMKVEFDNIIPFLYQEEAITDLEKQTIYATQGDITQVSKVAN